MENQTNKAIAELNELNDFLIEVTRHTPNDSLTLIGQKYPGYIEHLKTLPEMPENSFNLMTDFGIWSVLQIHKKYENVWDKASETSFDIAAAQGKPQLTRTLWGMVQAVLGSANL